MNFIHSTYTTQNLYLGKPEAEAENVNKQQNLSAFYEDFLNIEHQVRNGYFIISGRKGTGKSAYAWHLMALSENNENLYCNLVKKNDFNLEEIVQNLSGEQIKYESLFEWIILTRIVKLILDSKRGKSHHLIKAIADFYKKNAGFVDIDKYTVTEILTNKEVNFSPLKNNFGFFRSLFGSKSIKAPFYRMIQPLREVLQQIVSMPLLEDVEFYILFDDLDVNFKLYNENDCTMLMDLVRIVRRYNTEYFRDSAVRILILMRDDIADRLVGVDCDKNKIFNSYEHVISWYDHDMAQKDERNILLRRFINKRLAIAFKQLDIPYNIQDPWLTFVKEMDYEAKSSFKYILDHTFYIPRDLIMIFKDVGSKNMQLPLSHDDINSLLRDYSKMKRNEIEDELVALYTKEQIKSIFDSLKDVCNSWDANYSMVIDILKEHGLEESDFDNLLDYSLLIPIDKNGHMYFNYREKKMTNSYGDYMYNTPKILTLYFKSFEM